MPGTDQNSFSITNIALEETTLAQALAEVKRRSLGAYIQEVKDFTVGGQPALWVTLGCYPPLAMDQRWIAEKLWGLSTSENAGLCTSS